MIEILHLKKEYPTITPIKDLSVTINQGDVISVIGPSGCGKSTLLRMINMLERPTAGQIIVDGEDITVPNYPLNKLRQKVGMVFQSYNLFNHMTVIENICYAPIQLKGMDPESAYEKGMSLLADVGLSNFALSYPKTLSGGQKQRVAIARTLAMDPEIILFDEPTSALDPTMVGEVENVIKRLAAKGLTIMMVTHDMNFAERLPNRVFYLDEGGLYEDGTPKQIFKNPQKPKTIAFIKKFREFNCIIDSSNYDFMSLYTQIDQFAYRNDIPRKEKEKILAVFEELCFGIFKPQLKEEGTNVEFSIVYSDLLKDSRLSAKWNGFEIDLKDPIYKLEFGIIEHFSKSIKQEEPNSVRIKIKDE